MTKVTVARPTVGALACAALLVTTGWVLLPAGSLPMTSLPAALRDAAADALATAGPSSASTAPRLAVPHHFEPDLGQFGIGVPAYVARAPDRVLQVRADGFSVASADGQVDVLFDGADATAGLEGLDPMGPTTSYFMGQAQAVRGVPHYERVAIRGLYPGVDAVFYTSDTGEPEFDFVVAPGADPDAIRLRPGAGTALVPDFDGGLTATAPGLQVPISAPVTHQEPPGRGERQPVASAFEMAPDGSVGFRLGARDATLPTTIDPRLVYSTYFGGAADDEFAAVASFGGSVYAVGRTASGASKCTPLPSCPTAFNQAANGILVVRFDTTMDGSASLVWAAVVVGGDAIAYDIDADGTGVYIAGSASEGYYVTQNAFRTSQTTDPGQICYLGPDAVLTKVDLGGQDAPYSTFIGGGAADAAYGVAAGNGQPVIVGSTGYYNRQNFPVVGGFQPQHNGAPSTSGFCATGEIQGRSDAFVARFDAAAAAGPSLATGNPASLLYSTLMGGDNTDAAYGVALDGNGDIWVTGLTMAAANVRFPTTPGAFQSTPANADAFVVAVPGDASPAQLYGSLLGASADDRGMDIAATGMGANVRVYVGGSTDSPAFPVNVGSPSWDPTRSTARSGFVTALDPFQPSPLVQTAFVETSGPGSASDQSGVLSLQLAGGRVHAQGVTSSGERFPRLHAWPNLHGMGNDLFAVDLLPDLSGARLSTALGSPSSDHAGPTAPGHPGAAFVDAAGAGVVLVGSPSAVDAWPMAQSASNARVTFPSPRTFHTTSSGGRDGVLARLGGPSQPYVACGAVGPAYVGQPVTLTWAPPGMPHTQGIETYDAMAGGDPDWGMDPASYRWDFDYDGTFDPDPAADAQATPQHTYPPSTPPGPRTVRFEASDADGRPGYALCTVHLGNQFPVAACSTTTPGPFIVGQQVGLSSSGSADPDGAVASRQWSLAPDGAFVPPATPVSPNPLVTFPTAGAKDVRLQVTDDDGAVLDVQAIAYGGGEFIAVGLQGAMYASPDGQSWVPRTSGTGATLRGVAHSGSAWIAVGDGGTLLRSTDGLSWLPAGSPTPAHLHAVAHAAGTWVAVGDAGTVATSPDGLAWTLRSSGTSARLLGVAGRASGTQWLAVGEGGTIRSSANAIAWQTVTSGTTAALHEVLVSDSPLRWVVLGDAGTVLTSSDGATGWAATTMRSLSKMGSTWLAGGAAGLVLSSPDGVTWTLRAAPNPGNVHGIAGTTSAIVTAGINPSGSGFVGVSTNGGATWTTSTMGDEFHGVAAATASTSSTKWVVVGEGGHVRHSSSAAASSWSDEDGHSKDLYTVAYANTSPATHFWLAAGRDGAIATSTSPSSSWSANNVGLADYYGVAYASVGPGAKWVLVGESGTIRYATSPNPTTSWFTVASGTTQHLRAVTHTGSQWVAVGDNGVVVTSLDGISWSLQASGTTVALRGVAAGAGMVQAVGDAGTLVRNAGAGWAAVHGPTTTALLGAATAPDRWVAAGAGGVIRTATTPVFWTLADSGTTRSLRAVSASPAAWTAGGDGAMVHSLDTFTWRPRSIGPVAHCPVTVTEDETPASYCLPFAVTVYTDDMILFTAGGGDGDYAWSAPGGVPSAGTGGQFVTAFPDAGDFVVTVTSASITAQCSVHAVEPGPLSCTPAVASSLYGDAVTFTAQGGKPPYVWSVLGGVPASGGPGPSFTTVFPAGGLYYVTLESNNASVLCVADVEQPCRLQVGMRVSATTVAPRQPVTFEDASLGQVAARLWEFGDGTQASGASATHAFALPGLYRVRFTATEAASGCALTTETRIEVLEVPVPAPPGQETPGVVQPPIPRAGDDAEVVEGATFHRLADLVGESAEGATFVWTLVQGPHDVPALVPARELSFQAPMLDAPESVLVLRFEVRAARGAAMSAPDDLVVRVVSGDRRPVAHAGPDASVHVGEPLRLDGGGSYDPEGKPLAYAWRRIGGTGAQLDASDGPTPTVRVQGGPGSFVDLELTVSDGRWTASDTVRIEVAGTEPDVEDAHADTRQAPQSVGTVTKEASAWPTLLVLVAVLAALGAAVAAVVLRRERRRDP